MHPDIPNPQPSDTEAIAAPVPTNSQRLRNHLTPDGLAVTLLNAWNKGDPDARARMLTALHDFHKPK